MRGEAMGTFPKAYCISLQCDTTLRTRIVFTRVLFDLFRFVCDGWKNRAKCLMKFCMKLGKSATKTLEMLCEAFGKHTLSQAVISEWHSRFKACRVSAEDNKRSG
jgi:hypothetical protein